MARSKFISIGNRNPSSTKKGPGRVHVAGTPKIKNKRHSSFKLPGFPGISVPGTPGI